MTFTDDDLKRLKNKYIFAKQKAAYCEIGEHEIDEMLSLLARLEAAEIVVHSADRLMFTREITDELLHGQFLEWMKVADK